MQPSEDERILAALAHASIIANIVNLAGVIATALIWTSERERSEYVRQHALQSLLYQGLVLLILIVLMIFWGLCLGLSLLPVAVRPDLYRSSPPNSFWIALLGLALPLGFGILATLYGLYGAYQVYRGRPFSYPIAGRFMRRGTQTGAALRPSPASQPAELVVPTQAAEPAATAHDESTPSPIEPEPQAAAVRTEPADQQPGDETQ
jgi:uncharacterized Tic20 family protein